MVVVFFVLVSVVAVVVEVALVLVLVLTILVVFLTVVGVVGVDGGDFLLPVLTGCSAMLAGGILRDGLDDGADGAISTFS